MLKTRDEILREHPLLDYLERHGVKVKGAGRDRKATRCGRTKHRDDHWCVSVNSEEQIWHCNDCEVGGSVIDWIMHERNISVRDAMTFLSGGHNCSSNGNGHAKPSPRSEKAAPTGKPQIVATYDYVDESLQLVYQAVRLEPKDFRQRRPAADGKWIWSMEGVTRLLFNLPAVIKSQLVSIPEGEKDCQTLEAFGYVSTCNVGGAGKWLPAYAERLKGKDVLVFPDNDKPGTDHAAQVIASLDTKANSIKKIVVPSPHKDITEFVESFTDKEKAAAALKELIEQTAHTVKPLPVYTIAEMEAQYRENAQRKDKVSFDLGLFLPRLRKHIRPMVPGEVLLLLADTGVGKTCLIQQLLRAAHPMPSLLFELELPLNLLFERFVQMERGCYSSEVESEYKELSVPIWKTFTGLHHITVCPESGLTTDQIENYIVRSELKIGRRPVVVAVDYVGLLNQRGSRSRYEAVSKTAEDLKVIAKRTNTIVILASQVGRPDNNKKSLAVGLHDGKDSGALECSAGVVIGAWRPEKHKIMLKILKNTTGGTIGETIEAHFDGGKMMITPASPIAEDDALLPFPSERKDLA